MVLYWIGALIGRERTRAIAARLPLIKVSDVDRTEAWFQRHGRKTVFFGRMIPLFRSFVSIPAGIFEAPFRRYTVLTLIGSAIWCFVLAGVGWALGSRWEDFHHAFHYVDYTIVALIVAGAAYLMWKVLQRRGRPATDPR